ncbi:hypothetical protein M758_6G198500 [Ceratodon purpureus]|nr:hypothetical protein M758_6G198500 [Ceratodon purpureus]
MLVLFLLHSIWHTGFSTCSDLCLLSFFSAANWRRYITITQSIFSACYERS